MEGVRIRMSEDPFSSIESKPNGSKIIKRVFHTRTEMLMYPGNKVYPGKTSSWFEDKIYSHKPKVKKKAVVKDSTLTSEESY